MILSNIYMAAMKVLLAFGVMARNAIKVILTGAVII